MNIAAWFVHMCSREQHGEKDTRYETSNECECFCVEPTLLTNRVPCVSCSGFRLLLVDIPFRPGANKFEWAALGHWIINRFIVRELEILCITDTQTFRFHSDVVWVCMHTTRSRFYLTEYLTIFEVEECWVFCCEFAKRRLFVCVCVCAIEAYRSYLIGLDRLHLKQPRPILFFLKTEQTSTRLLLSFYFQNHIVNYFFHVQTGIWVFVSAMCT